jgi:cell division protein FtsL
MIIPEYIIVMTWILAAVIILSIIAAILFRLYIMFLYSEKEALRDKASDIQNQIYSAKNELYNLKQKIEELEAKKETLK